MNGARLAQAMPRMRMVSPRIRLVKATWKDAKSRFKNLKRIGAGSFGEVYSGILGGQRVIVKHALGLQGIVSMNEAFEALKNEIAILHKLQKFPFVPRLVEVGIDYFVQEDMGGEAMVWILARRGMEARQILSTVMAAATMISLIHREGIAHGDLGPQNILLTPQGVAIIDFGISVMRSKNEGKWRDAMHGDIHELLEDIQLAAGAMDVPTDAKIILSNIVRKFKDKLERGEVNEHTGSELARELFFVTAQLGARHRRNGEIRPEKVRIRVV